MAPIRVASLCSGIGGPEEAFKKLGWVSVYACDMDKYACQVFEANNPETVVEQCSVEEVHGSDIPAHEILHFSPPCQPYSIAGKMLNWADLRSGVLSECCRIVVEARSPVVTIENVRLFVTKYGAFERVKEALTPHGYLVSTNEFNPTIPYNATDFGAPATRLRSYIVAVRGDVANRGAPFRFTNPPALGQPVPLAPHLLPPDEVRHMNESLAKDGFLDWPVIHSSPAASNKPLRIGRNCRARIRLDGHGLAHVFQNYCIYDPRGPAATLLAGPARPLYLTSGLSRPPVIRRLHIRECLSCLGFPQTFKLEHEVLKTRAHKLLGNSVSLPVFEHIAKALLTQLPRLAGSGDIKYKYKHEREATPERTPEGKTKKYKTILNDVLEDVLNDTWVETIKGVLKDTLEDKLHEYPDMMQQPSLKDDLGRALKSMLTGSSNDSLKTVLMGMLTEEIKILPGGDAGDTPKSAAEATFHEKPTKRASDDDNTFKYKMILDSWAGTWTNPSGASAEKGAYTDPDSWDVYYLVRWGGGHEDTWEPSKNLPAADLVAFHKRSPKKMGPPEWLEEMMEDMYEEDMDEDMYERDL